MILYVIVQFVIALAVMRARDLETLWLLALASIGCYAVFALATWCGWVRR